MTTLRISRHARERYLERVACTPGRTKADLDSAMEAILIAIEPFWRKLGAGAFPVGDGYLAVVADDTVVTIVHRDMLHPEAPILRRWKKGRAA